MFSLLRPLIHLLPPETAHNLGIFALQHKLLPAGKIFNDDILHCNLWGLNFKNPVGLAAGFDKNARAVDALLLQGFGFVEMGTVTPLAQPGNPAPRIFRLSDDEAVINRLGFNNDGLENFVKNFSARDKSKGVAGANIGKNKESADAISDYVIGMKSVYEYADYITINISSPNTKGLRDLQKSDALGALLKEISNMRSELKNKHRKTVPVLLKVAPDLDMREKENIVSLVIENAIDGIIISNTTLSRPESLRNSNKKEEGGLSGRPLFVLSTKALSDFYKISKGKIPLVGVGGISSAEDAYEKIRAGASLVQLYTALVYQGFGVIYSINSGLAALLKRDGFSNIKEAIGTKS